MPHKVVPLQKQQEVSETSGGWRTVPLQPQLLVSSDWCVSLPTDSVTVKVSPLRSESASSFHGQLCLLCCGATTSCACACQCKRSTINMSCQQKGKKGFWLTLKPRKAKSKCTQFKMLLKSKPFLVASDGIF